MNITIPDIFSATFDSDWRSKNELGQVVLTIFDYEVYRSEECEYPSEYVLDDLVETAKKEFGELIAERVKNKVKIDEFKNFVVE